METTSFKRFFFPAQHKKRLDTRVHAHPVLEHESEAAQRDQHDFAYAGIEVPLYNRTDECSTSSLELEKYIDVAVFSFVPTTRKKRLRPPRPRTRSSRSTRPKWGYSSKRSGASKRRRSFFLRVDGNISGAQKKKRLLHIKIALM